MFHSHLPNVAVQWVALCIEVISGSNVNLHTGYPVIFYGIPQSLQIPDSDLNWAVTV
jgi:hypothetical protein